MLTRTHVVRWSDHLRWEAHIYATYPELGASIQTDLRTLATLCPHPITVSDSDRGPHCPDCGSPVPTRTPNATPGRVKSCPDNVRPVYANVATENHGDIQSV